MRQSPLHSFALALMSLLLMGQAPDSGQPSVLVQLTKLQRGSLPKTVMAYGTVQADPSAGMTVTAPLSAVVGSVYVRPGEESAKGTALVRLVPNPQTSSSYAQASSALQNARDQVAHEQELYSQSLATNQDLANAKKAELDAAAVLAALRKQGAAGPTVVRTPFDAIVTKLSVSVGSTVDVGTPLVDLAPPNSLVLQVGVVADQASDIMPGNKASVTAVGGTKMVEGEVILRGAIVDTSTGLVPVEISLPLGALLPGQTAEATITTGTVEGYVVPHEAILVNDSGEPYVVQAIRMTAKIVPIRVVGAQGDKDLIEGKLDANAALVLAGNYQLQDGMRVRLSDPPEK